MTLYALRQDFTSDCQRVSLNADSRRPCLAGKQDPILVVGGGLGGLTAALALGAPWHERCACLKARRTSAPSATASSSAPTSFSARSHRRQRRGDGKGRLSARRADVRRARRQGGHAGADRGVVPALASSIPTSSSTASTCIMCCSTPAGAIRSSHSSPTRWSTRFEDHGDGVAVTTEDGRSFEGAALIGADGIRSRMRAAIDQ